MDVIDRPGPSAYPLVHEPSDRTLRVPVFLDSAEGRALDPDPTGTDGLAAEQLLQLEPRLGTTETRWAPSAVARLLLTWSPTSGVAATDPQRLLVVLRSLVCHAHAEDRVPRQVTVRSIAVIEALAEEFVERVHWGAGSAFAHAGRRWSRQQTRLHELALEVGGGRALLDLDTAPLPDEPLELTEVPDDLVGLVRELDGLVDRALDERWDAELLTACRRALVQLATTRPAVLRRRASVLNTAVGLAWAVGSANGAVGAAPASWSTEELATAFGSTGGSGRGQTLLEALSGRRSWSSPASLASPRLLTSGRRASLVEERDRLLAVLDERGMAVSARNLDARPTDTCEEERWWWTTGGAAHR